MKTGDHEMRTDERAVGDAIEDLISHQTMRDLHSQGLATPLSRLINDHIRYAQRWWIADSEGWHLVTDDTLNNMLDIQSKWVDGNIYLGGR